MKRVVIISPDYPPRVGGVADHTAHLAERLAEGGEVTVLTSAGVTGSGGVEVRGEVRDWGAVGELRKALGRLPGDAWWIWQYVPHMYGRGGVNGALVEVVEEGRLAGRRQTVWAHEVCASWSVWPHRAWWAWRQRVQWRRLARAADWVVVSSEPWLERWGGRWAWFRSKAVLLGSPSNIAVAPVQPGHGRRWREEMGWPGEALVLLFFGSLGSTKQLGWIERSWRELRMSGGAVGLAVLGGGGEAAAGGKTGEGEGWRKVLGYRPPAEVSAALQAADLVLLPYVDGVAERRTSFMAGLSHGRAVVTTLGWSTGRTLRGGDFFVGVEVGEEEGFVRAVARWARDGAGRGRLGEAARRRYVEEYDWPVVVERLCQCWAGGMEGGRKGRRP